MSIRWAGVKRDREERKGQLGGNRGREEQAERNTDTEVRDDSHTPSKPDLGERERERETDRQTDRQKDRQTETETDRHRESEREGERERRASEREIEREKDRERYRER